MQCIDHLSENAFCRLFWPVNEWGTNCFRHCFKYLNSNKIIFQRELAPLLRQNYINGAMNVNLLIELCNTSNQYPFMYVLLIKVWLRDASSFNDICLLLPSSYRFSSLASSSNCPKNRHYH